MAVKQKPVVKWPGARVLGPITSKKIEDYLQMFASSGTVWSLDSRVLQGQIGWLSNAIQWTLGRTLPKYPATALAIVSRLSELIWRTANGGKPFPGKYPAPALEIYRLPEKGEIGVFRLGDPVRGWLPTEKDLEDFRNLIMKMAAGSGSQFLVTHYGVGMENRPAPVLSPATLAMRQAIITDAGRRRVAKNMAAPVASAPKKAAKPVSAALDKIYKAAKKKTTKK